MALNADAPLMDGYRHTYQTRFVLAADLGQSIDPTAIAVIEHRKKFLEYYKGGAKLVAEQFDVRHLARLPLGLSYPEVVQEVATLIRRPPLLGNVDVVIDETGVGRAVGDIFDAAGLHATRISITAGNDHSANGRNGWNVAKSILISTLDARLHTGELRFAAELLEAGAMRDELKDFRRKVGNAGRFSYEARVGKHDDLVLAVAIGLWFCVGRPKPAQPAFGTW